MGGGTPVVIPPIRSHLRGASWLTCGAAWADGPLDADPTFTDISTWLRRAKITRGRGDERDTFREGRCDLTIDNRTRRFEPGYTGSPYSPNVRPNRQVWLTAAVGDNLLDHDTATMADSIGQWTTSVVEALTYTGDVTLEWSAKGRDGVGCLKVTNTGGDPYYQTPSGTDGVPVTAGATYTAIAWFKPAVGTTPTTGYVRITWYTAAGAYISQTTGSGALGSDWTLVTASGAAPGTAAFAAVRLGAGATPTDVHFVDTVALLAGTSVDFEYGTDVPLFRGLIDAVRPTYTKGLPAPTGGDAEVEVRCTDLTKLLAACRLTNPFDVAVADLAPSHWWRMDEDEHDTEMSDDGSDPVPGVWADTAKLGQAPAVDARSRSSVLVTSEVDAGRSEADVLTGTDWTISVQAVDFAYTNGAGPIVALFAGPTNSSYDAGVVIDSAVDATTVTVTATINETGTPIMTGHFVTLTGYAPRVGKHSIVITKSGTTVKLYLDGAEQASATFSYVARSQAVIIGGTKVTISPGARVSDLIVLEGTALTAPNVAALHAAAVSPWAGDTVGERAARVFAQVGIPPDLYNIDPKTTMALGAQLDDLDGVTALDYLRLLEQTEAGRLYVSPAGRVTLLGRHATLNTDPVVTWGDDPTAGELQYADIVESYDDQRITNRATIQRQGGSPQTAFDAASEADYGTHEDRKTGLMLGSDNLAADLAGWIVDHYAEPVLRFEQVELFGHRTADHMVEAAVRGLTDRVNIKRRPPGGGDPQDNDSHIEGIDHDIDFRRRTWTVRYDLSPADLNGYWVLQDPTFGVLETSSRLAF